MRKASQLSDTPLKLCLKRIRSFMCESLDFLNKCPRDVDEDSGVVTYDVVSLYTVIPHEFNLKVIDYFLTKYEKDLLPKFSKEFVLELVNYRL